MSGLGTVQSRLSNATTKVVQNKAFKALDPLGSAVDRQTPHYAQQEEQRKQDQNADDLGAQQAADAAAAARGPESMAVRDQLMGAATNESGGITSSGNEADMAGTPLGARRRAARRVLVG